LNEWTRDSIKLPDFFICLAPSSGVPFGPNKMFGSATASSHVS